MTVSELIKRLQRCDPDAEVVFCEGAEDEYAIDFICEVKRICVDEADDYCRVELQ